MRAASMGTMWRLGVIAALLASCGDSGETGSGSETGEPTSSSTGGGGTMPVATGSDTTDGASADATGSGASTGATLDGPASEGSSGAASSDEGSSGIASSSSDEGGSSESSGTTGEAMVTCPPGPADTVLTGTVWAPNGEIPVSGALVYTSQNMPDGIPQHVYCSECAQLECDDEVVFTDVDGTFTLGTNAAEANWLVVQKGQFMRISPLNLAAGNVALPDALTTLPDHNDPANGVYIPRIAVANGTFDRLEDALGKLGLGDTLIQNFEERLVPGTEPFHLWDNGLDPANDGFLSQGTFDQLVSNPAELANYHIIFVPCSGDEYVSSLTAANIQNIRDWVDAGGRWYVADWANEWMGQVFPEYQTFQGGNFGGGDLGVYDSLADVLDPDMLAWLEALPDGLKDINPLNDESHPTLFELPLLQTVDNWSAIIATPPVLVDDGMGGQIDVGHKIWLEGDGAGVGVHPLTVSGQYGCGRIQFTSYHTAEFFDYVGLSPQELVLVYTILEIGVCQYLPS
jgi:hypothetical protein